MQFRQALLYTFTSKYLLLLIQFGSTLILSRLLTPADIGIYTIAYSLVVIGHVFRDFGVGNYIQQEKDLTRDRIRAAMAITLAFAWLMAVALYLSADYAAEFYQEEGVKKVFQVLALNFLLIPFGSVTTSYIRRKMRFKFVMKLEVVCTLVSTATVISLAYLGFSYMSLAWSSVAGIVVEISILLYFRPKELPNFPGLKEIKHVLSFSTASVSESLLAQLGSTLPDLIVGKYLGMSAVGVLSRAHGTIKLFDRAVTEGINPVLLPYFSKENRQGASIKKPFLYVTSCITGLAWPIFLYIAIMAEPLIFLLYGEQWAESIVLLQILCVKSALWKSLGFIHPALMSLGKVNVLLKFQLWFFPIYIVTILLSVSHGLVAMLISVTIFSIIKYIITLIITCKELDILLYDFYKVFIQCLVPTSLCALALYLFRFLSIEQFSYFEELLISGVLFGVTLFISFRLVKHPLYLETMKFYQKIKGI